MVFRGVSLVVMGLLMLGAAVSRVEAQSAASGLDARLLGSIPEGAAISVDVYDDTPEVLRLKERMILSLRRHGVLVVDSASLELMIDPVVKQGGVVTQGPSLGYVGTTENGVELNANVYSTTQDSLLQGRRKNEPSKSPRVANLNAVLSDREAGQVVWQGDAWRAISDYNRDHGVWETLVDPLAEAFGKTKSLDNLSQ